MNFWKISLLSASMVLSLTLAGQPEGIVSHYKFSGNASDEYGYRDGVVMNASLTTDRFGEDNSAYLFSPDSLSAISLGDGFEFFSEFESKFSFSFWFQLNDTSKTNIMLLSKYGNINCGEAQREFFIRINDNRKLEFLYFSSFSIYDARGIEGSTIIADTNWHHVVINYNGSIHTNNGKDRVEIYLDNKKEVSNLYYQTGSLGNIQNSNAHLAIGSALGSQGQLCDNGYTFRGKLDDLRIYNKNLNEEEILHHFYEDVCRIIKYDTIVVHDTIVAYDTIVVHDTIIAYDTIVVHDTIVTYDTVIVYDTIPVYNYISVTDTLFIYVNLNTSSNIQQEIGTIMIYPNPASDMIFINIKNQDLVLDYKISIMDINAKKIFETLINQSEFQIDVSDFGSKGIYFINILNKDNEIIDVRKIILK